MYGPDSEAWALARESMLLLGAGPRALLLQIAHPAVAAGVDEHSDFRADPWRRLAATLKSYLTIVYGSGPAARAEIRRLEPLHARHRRHRATAPAIPSSRCGSTPRSSTRRWSPTSAGSGRSRRERRERAYQETRPIGRAFGVPEALLPADLAAFDAYMAADAGTRRTGPAGTARPRAGRGHPPSAARATHPGGGAAPVPDPAGRRTAGRSGRRSACCRRPSATSTASRGVRASALVSAWLVAGWRAWRPLIPRTWRQMPKALAADARIAANAQPASGRQASSRRRIRPTRAAGEPRPEHRRPQVDRRRGVERIQQGHASPGEPVAVRRDVAAQGRPERGRAHLLAGIVEQVAALDVDRLVVAGGRVLVDRAVQRRRGAAARAAQPQDGPSGEVGGGLVGERLASTGRCRPARRTTGGPSRGRPGSAGWPSRRHAGSR